jgi:hypothetical protein
MKILLDENLPVKLRNLIEGEHQVFTVFELGWSGKKNGELLTLLEEERFDLFITADKNLQFQQNLKDAKVGIFVLNAPNNRFDTLSEFMEKTNKLIETEPGKGIHIIEIQSRTGGQQSLPAGRCQGHAFGTGL